LIAAETPGGTTGSLSPVSILHRIPSIVWWIAGLAIVARAGIAIATRFTFEDFYITLRYVENIAHGRGFVYNPNERVLGTTTPLYTLLLALFTAMGLPPIVVGKAINILADGALCIVVYLWLRELNQESAGRAAAFLVAISPIHLRWSISGMETSLVTLFGAWIWLLYVRRSYLAAFAAMGVLFLIRWDSLLLAVVLTTAVVLRERRLPWREIGLYVLIISPWLLFAFSYFGYFIPVTGAAKVTVYGWRYRFEILPLWPKLQFRLIGTPVYASLTAFALAGLWLAWKRGLNPLIAPLAWFLLYWITFLISKVLLFEWYLPPTLPVYEVFVALGLVYVSQLVFKKIPSRIATGLTYSSAACVYVCVIWLMYGASLETQKTEENLRIPLGLWLKANAAPTDRIFLEPIGYVGYYSERPVLDAVGLVSPSVLRFYTPRTSAPWLDMVRYFHPEWCVLRPGEFQHILDGSRSSGYAWDNEYELVHSVSYTPRVGKEPETFLIYRLKKRS